MKFTINGKPGRLYKRDEYTVVFEFPEPYYLFVDILAGDTLVGGGQGGGPHARGRRHSPSPPGFPPQGAQTPQTSCCAPCGD